MFILFSKAKLRQECWVGKRVDSEWTPKNIKWTPHSQKWTPNNEKWTPITRKVDSKVTPIINGPQIRNHPQKMI